MTTRISAMIAARLSPDILINLYDAAYCAGAGLPCAAPTDPTIADLVRVIADRYERETMAARGWLSPPPDAALPAWLQSLPDNPQLRAAAERALALETERPHDWIRGIANEGKP